MKNTIQKNNKEVHKEFKTVKLPDINADYFLIQSVQKEKLNDGIKLCKDQLKKALEFVYSKNTEKLSVCQRKLKFLENTMEMNAIQIDNLKNLRKIKEETAYRIQNNV